MNTNPKGSLIIIGGHEAKTGAEAILREVAARTGNKNRLVIVTVASQQPEELTTTYREVFGKLGVKHIDALDIRTRDEATDPDRLKVLEDATVIFFTGGDQLRITSQLGDSPLYQQLHQCYQAGGTIAGTSAGAAVMPATMLISGASDNSQSLSGLGMAPGLGLLDGVVIDSHFAERGRMGRLLGAVVQNPRNLGLGIDEDTAIVVERGARFRVLGSGAVYVLDGATLSFSSLSEERPTGVITIHGVTMHVLGADDHFDLTTRTPICAGRED